MEQTFKLGVLEVLRSSPLASLVRQLQDAVPVHGSGSPEAVVMAGPGGLYVDDDDGTLWVHEDPARSDTGWVQK